MLCLKEGPNQPGPIFSTLYILHSYIFLLINYSLRDPHYIHPRIFLFSRPHFMTHICDSHFATHFAHDSHSRLTFATHVHDFTHDSHLRLTFMTHIRDSCSHSQSQLAVSVTSPSCDSTTDRQTVPTPQHHLPTIPTLTLIKNFGTFSLAWPPPIATAHHHVHHP